LPEARTPTAAKRGAIKEKLTSKSRGLLKVKLSIETLLRRIRNDRHAWAMLKHAKQITKTISKYSILLTGEDQINLIFSEKSLED
jgi:6-phosphogluconate dehydrogenase (decarboxylating)